ncbi:MAG: DNA topoisomerase III [Verrucomicrobia bacterium]|nr:MAG: DNA topoisomerase III [Verrucomicrobiota bacterium]PYK95660.1 MAG: DNA topoisomerase III [Verrucomicrobiota bacterium]
MSKSLIIAEKPSVARDLARALGKFKHGEDFFENEQYVISWSVGHVVELQMPEDIDKKKYGFWRLETLPIIPDKFELKPSEHSTDRFNVLKKLIARKDFEQLINACDAGREGELIFTNLCRLAKNKHPVKRLWLQSMTPQAIRDGFQNLRDGSEMAGLADAARSRSESDWLIGINGTRAITKRMFGSRGGNVASVGRVQTPTLALVYARELEIRSFKPRGYWRVTAKFEITKGEYEGTYQRPDFKKNGDEHDRIDRIWDQAAAEAIVAECQGQPVARVSEEKKASSQIAPRLYDLTTLQREANRWYGFSAKRTLDIAQALYEKHKMLTYPRTDSRALPEDYLPVVRRTLENLSGVLQRHAQKALEKNWVQFNKRIFNNAQISDHFAIIPTTLEAKSLNDAEAKIFDMVARRFVATFYPVAEFDVTTRLSQIGVHKFKTEGKVMTSAGWREVYSKSAINDDSTQGKALPALSAEDKRQAKTLDATLRTEATKPPPRYTEATLLFAMETAGKFVEDEELAEAMKERGLGTPATRADTIDGLIRQKYMDRQQRDLVPTAKAEQLIQFLTAVKATDITSPAMTGEWAHQLRLMEQGKFPREKFMAEIVEETKGIVERVKGFEEDDSVARTTDIISPTDGKPLRETLRGYKSQDGELMIYKVIGGRKMEESEVRELVEKGVVGPLDGFISAKTRASFAATLKLVKDEKKGKWKAEYDFGDKVDLGSVEPFWTDPATGAELCEVGSSYVLRKRENGEWKQVFRVPRLMCKKEVSREQAVQLVEKGKTDLIKGFISKKGRPFDAFLLRNDAKIRWEFPPRAPKTGKDGKPVERKARAKVDLSKAKVIGESKVHGGELVEVDDAYYVRKPDQDNRQVFKLTKKRCEHDITPDEVKELLSEGKSQLIENFVSKRGNKFAAYLKLSAKKDKAEFEFPPR